MKQFDTLVSDIYTMLENKDSPLSDAERLQVCKDFGDTCQEMLWDALQPEEVRTGLRLSAVGKPLRQLWYQLQEGHEPERIRGSTYIKFLYGHLVEALVLSLAEAAGHEVTDRQKECEVSQVVGHMDARIDGVLVDVKSCSSFGFKKFRDNTLHEDDPFGYIGQLKAYAASEGDTYYGWLAMDKQNGTLCTLMYDEGDKDAVYAEAIDYDITERIRELKTLVASLEPPERCYEDVPDGKSGNRKLVTGCIYCQHKHECWPGLRVVPYAQGPRYLTVVEREPRVKENLPDGF